MIDFIKLSKRISIEEQVQLSKNLDCNISIVEKTGEVISLSPNGKRVKQHSECWIKNMKIKLYPNHYTEVSGSLHKYFNNGIHNYNQFGLTDLNKTISILSEKTSLDLPKFKVDAVEVGCNFSPPIPSEEIIQNSLMYKRSAFESKICSDEGSYKQANLDEYAIKLYDKKKHYEMRNHDVGEEILRFEIKINKMRKLSSFSVFHLSDLVNNLHKIKDILPELWDHVLHYDPAMNEKIKEETIRYANVNFWINLLKKKNRSYHYHHKKLYRLMEENNCSIQAQVKKIIIETLDALV